MGLYFQQMHLAPFSQRMTRLHDLTHSHPMTPFDASGKQAF